MVKMSKTKKITALVLCLGIMLSFSMLLVMDGPLAQAKTSLPGVEEIKLNKSDFNILELAPAANQGSVGYYVPGQEPIANWKQTAAGKGLDERREYLKKLFSDMSAAGLIGNGEYAPLRGKILSGSVENKDAIWFREYLPWEAPETTDGSIVLNHSETAKATGNIEDVGAGKGDYTAGGYSLLEEPNGSYKQHVVGFVPGDGKDLDSYYYDVEFEPVEDGAPVDDGELIYVEAQPGQSKDLTVKIGEKEIALHCLGVKGDPGFPIMVRGLPHYKAVFDRPFATYDENDHPYRAVSTGFDRVDDNTGWFAANAEAKKLTYVGKNKGSIKFTPGDGEEYTIEYSEVFYRGGFENNNWFLKYVFDWEENEPAPGIAVTTVTPEQLPKDLSDVDMIVLTGGFVPNGTASAFAGDITEEAQAAVKEFAEANKPVIVDIGLSTKLQSKEHKNLSTLVQKLAEKTGGKVGVNGSVYIYSAPLATSDFATPFEPAQYLNSDSPFFDVYAEIDYENFLRKQAKPDIDEKELLSETVSMASAIRYTLNYANSRGALAKTSLSVLEIQPRTGSENETLELKKNVAKWSGLEPGNIKITTMSTSEFIGKIEDLSETYDLIYIGDSLGGFDTRENGTIANYTDDNMDGLLYTNIGDTVVAGADEDTIWGWDIIYRRLYKKGGWDLSGLLDRDYTNTSHTSQISANDTSRTFRLSGNDLTEAKMEELTAFVQAGYPIVVGKGLTTMRVDADNTAKNGSASAGYSTIGVRGNFSAVTTWDPAYTEMTVRVQQESGSTATVSNGKVTLYVNGAEAETVNFYNGDPVKFKISSYEDGTEVFYTIEATQLRLNLLGWRFNVNAEISTTAQSAKYTFKKGISNGLVDGNSYMYKLLKETSQGQFENVVAEENLNEEAYAQFRRYLNLSKPVIDFTGGGKPTEYNENNKVSLTADGQGNYNLEYTFTINNATDPDPASTGYLCRMYVDLNGDGRHTSDELLDGVRVYEESASGPSIAQGSLRAGVRYCAVRQLPAGLRGVIPWKLEIVKAGAEHIHASETGFSYIKPDEPVKINILQINTSLSGRGLDLSAAFADKRSNFGKLVSETIPAANGEPTYHVVGDYAISVETKTAATADFTRLNEYDMLILGFDDCWQELSADAAKAVVEYIETGKAVLFSHDTSSFSFLPDAEFKLSSQTYRQQDRVYNTAYWNYNFNTILRDAVGLDRYGVTSEAYGKIKRNSPVTNNYSGTDDSKKQEILNAGYSIAWQPSSLGGGTTVPETQGLNNWLLMRYYISGGKAVSGLGLNTQSSKMFETTTVSQVNKGQITTYPFNVNLKEFGGSWAGNIAKTHNQYFQLNMNSDDIVVWYCLSGDTYSRLSNDVMNSYYIYSRGNVTYTGMGHTPDGVTESEAKLFVNTMVAAYRIAQPGAGVDFTDSEGVKDDAIGLIIPADGDSLISTDGSKEESRRVYFVVTDDSIGAKKINVSFGFSKDDAPLTLTVYNKLNRPTAQGSLVSGEVYYVLVDDIMKMPGFSANEAQTLYIKATIKQEGQPEKTGTDSIPIYKFSLFSLS